jgi:drug/metabolite transporter (DMT)-like permease
VAARYLQVYATPIVFNGQSVLASTKGFAAVVVFTMGSFKSLCCSEQQQQQYCKTIEENNKDETKSLSPVMIKPQTSAKEVSINENENVNNDITTITTTSILPQRILYATIFATVATTRALSNIASAKYTYPYNLALIANTSPIITALLDKVLLNCPYPPILWRTAIVTVMAGSIIAISQSMTTTATTTNNNDVSSISDDNIHGYNDSTAIDIDIGIGVVTPTQNIIGCSLQLLSVIFSALSRILIKHTEHILSETHIVQVNNLSGFVFPFIITLCYDPYSSWNAFMYLLVTPKSLLAWSTISIVVYSYASIQQVKLVRQLGPGFYSSWAACRLLGTIALSALCLGEGIGSNVEWVGVIILVVTMTVYMNETSKWIDERKSSSSSSSSSCSTSNDQQQQQDEDEDCDSLDDDDGDEELVSMNSREVKPLIDH